MSESSVDLKDVEGAKVNINGISLEELVQVSKHIKEFGVRKPVNITNSVTEIAKEVAYLLSGYTMSAYKAAEVLDRTKELILENARLYRQE